MFILPPTGANSDNNISEKVLPPLPPAPQNKAGASYDETSIPEKIPYGDELFYYVLSCLEHGSSPTEVRKQLRAFGYLTIDADEILQTVQDYRKHHSPNQKTPDSNGANPNVWIGGVVCLFGLVVTIGSFAASSNGGSYVVAYGAIFWGAIQFFRGITQSDQS